MGKMVAALAVFAGFYVDEKDRDGDVFLFRFADAFLSWPRRGAVGLTGTLLIIERSVREAPLK